MAVHRVAEHALVLVPLGQAIETGPSQQKLLIPEELQQRLAIKFTE